MELEELCFSTNETLLKNFANQFGITLEQLKEKLKLVGKHEQLLNMAIQVNDAYKKNPNISVNFGDYGAKIANDLHIKQEEMYEAIIVCAYNDLLTGIARQLNSMYNK